MTAEPRGRKNPPKRSIEDPPPGGFDVTCVIGRVEFGEGDEHSSVVAFKLIAQHDAPGVYSFPNADGTTCRVTVEHIMTPEQERDAQQWRNHAIGVE